MMVLLSARVDNAPLVFFLGIAGFVVTLVVIAKLRKRAFERMCNRVADALGGVYEAPGLFERPTIRFRIEGRRASIEFEAGNRPFTFLRVDLRGRSPGTMKIIEERLGQSFLKFFGAQDVEIGDPDFDRRYVLKAAPESLVAQVFAPHRRPEAMRAVRRLKGLRQPSIELTDEVLDVEVKERLDIESAILALAETGKDFVDFLLHLETATGIEWIDGRATDAGVCPVCATGLAEPLLRCAECSLPHHEDCWTWLGKCSAYACDGRRPGRRAA